ncbi:hypothetical protein BU17DRAFT_44674 [Hysterangium stoloniferum]|nr:hypothetical protein BU17DRAFT_44674 [Hysterangium stoloniferum]
MRLELGTQYCSSSEGSVCLYNTNDPSHRDTRDTSTDINAWEHIFEGLDTPATSPSALRDGHDAFPTRPRKLPQQPMTASEISAFDNMFDMIFSATMEKRQRHTAAAVAARTGAGNMKATTAAGSLAWSNTGEVDAGPSDVFGRRTHSSRIRRTTEMDELFDRLKESVDLCGTDWEVMQWAGTVLFQEAQPAATPPDSEASTQVRLQSETPTQAQQPESPSQQQSQTQPQLQPQQMSIPPPIYSLLLTYLMCKMRVSHRNPRASLALFAHAKQRSIASYVFGCTTPAYNELLRARWAIEGLGTAAGDNEGLRGVESVLREMKANGVGFDSSTRAFVEDVRREVGRTGIGSGVEMEMESGVVAREREWEGSRGWPQAEETVGLDVHEDKDGGEETVWEAMVRIEEVLASSKRRRRGRHDGIGRDERGDEAEGSGNLSRKDGKMEARRKHWDEEWKMEGGEAGLAIGEEDRLTLE